MRAKLPGASAHSRRTSAGSAVPLPGVIGARAGPVIAPGAPSSPLSGSAGAVGAITARRGVTIVSEWRVGGVCSATRSVGVTGSDAGRCRGTTTPGGRVSGPVGGSTATSAGASSSG